MNHNEAMEIISSWDSRGNLQHCPLEYPTMRGSFIRLGEQDPRWMRDSSRNALRAHVKHREQLGQVKHEIRG